MEEDLQRRPFTRAEETPSARRENEGVPSGHGKSADEEVLVGGEMRGQVEVGREDLREVGDGV